MPFREDLFDKIEPHDFLDFELKILKDFLEELFEKGLPNLSAEKGRPNFSAERGLAYNFYEESCLPNFSVERVFSWYLTLLLSY